ncbi:hypothetical protein ACFL46_06270 [Candidatus Neomarinimicrobiota bacterium]
MNKIFKVVSLVVILFFSCEPWLNYPKTIHFYDGQQLKRNALGEVYFAVNQYYQLDAVDGKDTDKTIRLYLLPGKHTILVKSRRRHLEASPYFGTYDWYIRNDVLMDVTIEAGHKYIFQSENLEKAMLSARGPFIKDTTPERNKTLVSQTIESKYAVYQYDDDYQIYNPISGIIRADVADYNIHTNVIGLLTIDVPYEGLPIRFQEYFNKKKWYVKGDIVEIAFSNRKRSKEKWHRWPGTLLLSGPVGYDIFIRTPNNSWYSLDFDRYVNKMK